MDFRIFTDSASDLTPDLITELDVSVLELKTTLTKPDGTVLDGFSLDYPDFYNALRAKCTAVTAAYSVGEVIEAVEPLLSAGIDVLFLAFSSGLSASCNSAKIAAEDLSQKYPDRKFLVLDTLCASLGEGLLVYHTVKYARAGHTIDETYAYAERTRFNLCHWFTVDDLFHLKRGGRVSGATALLGTMLNIRPVLHVDDEGHLINMEKAKGRKNSMRALLEHMKSSAILPEDQTVFICQGDCLEDAEELAGWVKESLGVKRVVIGYTGRVIGSHSGPGTLALFFLGNKR